MEGQITEINLVNNLLDTQILQAEEDKKKYVKMYKNLGLYIGLAIVVILA